MKRAVMFLGLCLWTLLTVQPLRAEMPSTIDEVVKRGVLRVGFSSFVPWAMQDKDGKFIGFEVDVAERLAQDLDVELQLVPTRWSGIIPALLAGKFDMIIGGMSSTPERNLKVNFSIPYDQAEIGAVANKEKAATLTFPTDYNNPNVIVALRTGSSAVVPAKNLLPNATYRFFDDEAPAVQDVLNGRAHIFFTSEPLPTFEALNAPETLFLPTNDSLHSQPIGIAVKRNDLNTLNFLDNWIRALHGEGWLKERRTYWFKTQDWLPRVQ